MMDSIQLTPKMRIKRIEKKKNIFTLSQLELSEIIHPLVQPYLCWLRKINASLNQSDLIEQNEQIYCALKLLYQHHLIFFLRASSKLHLIDELFHFLPFLIYSAIFLFHKEVYKDKLEKKNSSKVKLIASSDFKQINFFAIHNQVKEKSAVNMVYSQGGI